MRDGGARGSDVRTSNVKTSGVRTSATGARTSATGARTSATGNVVGISATGSKLYSSSASSASLAPASGITPPQLSVTLNTTQNLLDPLARGSSDSVAAAENRTGGDPAKRDIDARQKVEIPPKVEDAAPSAEFASDQDFASSVPSSKQQSARGNAAETGTGLEVASQTNNSEVGGQTEQIAKLDTANEAQDILKRIYKSESESGGKVDSTILGRLSNSTIPPDTAGPKTAETAAEIADKEEAEIDKDVAPPPVKKLSIAPDLQEALFAQAEALGKGSTPGSSPGGKATTDEENQATTRESVIAQPVHVTLPTSSGDSVIAGGDKHDGGVVGDWQEGLGLGYEGMPAGEDWSAAWAEEWSASAEDWSAAWAAAAGKEKGETPKAKTEGGFWADSSNPTTTPAMGSPSATTEGSSLVTHRLTL